MVGRITEAKGHRVLFNALGRLSGEVRNKIRLIIVGAPEGDCAEDLRYARGLEQYAKEIGLQNILWTGYREDVARYYASMDVLVQPSVAECGEALPLTVLEALQTGVPIIASRTGGIPEVVRNEFNGLLYSTGDEEELARSVERFVEDSSLRDRLRAGAQAPLDGRFSLATFTRNIRRAVIPLCGDSNKPAAPAYGGPFTWK
jgi:glycosyltransferase involved in cell wall biosynthesis